MKSFKDSEAYTPYDYQSDGFLGPKEVAAINARFRNKARQGTKPKTLDESYDEEVAAYRSAMPRINNLYAGLSGNWDVTGAKADASDMLSKNITSLTTDFGMQPAEARYVARSQVMKTLKTRRTDQKLSNIKVTNSSGDSIYVHMTVDGSGALVPKAGPEDFAAAVAGINAMRNGGFYKGKVNIHLLDDNSYIPKEIESQVNSGTIGFTFPGADSVRLYVDKIRGQVVEAQANPGYWSTDITDAASSMKHFVAHEIVHQIADEIYGPGADKKLSDDMRKFYEESLNTPDATSTNTPSDNSVSSHVEKIVDSQKVSEDLSSWTQTGGQQGSNDGGTFKDPATGTEIYAKFPQTQLHGENERLASALYQAMGIGSTNIVSGTVSGRSATYSEMIPGVKTDFDSKVRTDQSYLKRVQDGFAADALLANWDVTLNDNIVSDANGDPIRIDPGGALLFRARGNAKGSAFGDSVTELDSFVKPSSNPNVDNSKSVRIFGQMSDDQKKESAKHVQALKPADIDALVDSIITDKTAAAQLKTTLKNRRAYILKRYGLSDSADTSPTTARAKAHAASNKTIPAVSTRGAASDSENFAEMGAKYVLTGEAPEWFVKMLESHGIAKGRIDKAWRDALSATDARVFSIAETALAENEKGGYPETNVTLYGSTNRGYGRTHGILGSGSAHRLARLNGVRDNIAQLVDDFTPGWKSIFRAITPCDVDGVRKSSRDLKRELATSTDPYYSDKGGTLHGDGIYTGSSFSDARGYASHQNDVIEMAIDPNAKIYVQGNKSALGLNIDNTKVTIDQMRNNLQEMLTSLVVNELMPGTDRRDPTVIAKVDSLYHSLPIQSPNGSDKSNLAFLMGYDAIELSNGYVVILNRGILQVRKRDIA